MPAGTRNRSGRSPDVAGRLPKASFHLRRYEPHTDEADSLADQGVVMLKFYVSLQNYLSQPLRRDDRGATAVEYGLMVALIAAVIITIVTTLGTKLVTLFTTVSGAL
jgi:pilus assembly protein Flp/PilA